ncbi:hypothetical protein DKX38_027295 [Salix brachista]|uniref:Uncharacterized protein n=1 Tax=Salix brachista TaxID=2182728 RepID=A0A5N5JNI5_9ROSI|nr:hypothetical protein DKX38_027295 [Salix brachista]
MVSTFHINLQFIVLLVLRHTLPIIINGAGDYTMTLFMLLILRTVGILVPIYVMVRAFTAIQRRRRRQQDTPLTLSLCSRILLSPLLNQMKKMFNIRAEEGLASQSRQSIAVNSHSESNG